MGVVQKEEGGVKVHTLYDVKTKIPITTASAHDYKAMSEKPYEIGSYYIFDRAYNKFSAVVQYKPNRSILRYSGIEERAIQYCQMETPTAQKRTLGLHYRVYRVQGNKGLSKATATGIRK